MKKNEWLSLNVEIPDETVKFINCDTRDFHWIWCEETPDNNIDFSFVPEECLVDQKSIYFILNSIEIRTGGKGNWRHLEMVDGSWLKYIWFIRFDETRFAMVSGDPNDHCWLPRNFDKRINWSNPYVKTV